MCHEKEEKKKVNKYVYIFMCIITFNKFPANGMNSDMLHVNVDSIVLILIA